METTGVQMKCSMQEDESVPLFFFHTFIFSAQLPFSRCSESPVKQAFGCWAWPILLVRRWDNFIPEMNETNFVSQNTQGKSTFLEKAWHPLRLALKAVLQRPSCPFPQRLRRRVASLEAWLPEGAWSTRETKETAQACPPPPQLAAACAVTLGWLCILRQLQTWQRPWSCAVTRSDWQRMACRCLHFSLCKAVPAVLYHGAAAGLCKVN